MNEDITIFSDNGFLVSDNLNFKNIDFNEFIKYLKHLKVIPFIIEQEQIDNFNKINNNLNNLNNKSNSSSNNNNNNNNNNNSNFFKSNLNDKKVVVSSVKFREKNRGNVTVVKSYKLNNKKRNMKEWYNFYNNKFKQMKILLENRQELKNLTSISSIKSLIGKNEVCTIGIVKEFHKTMNDNLIITLEDLTGIIKCFISAKKKELMKLSEELVNDEVIGILGSSGTHFIYLNDIIFPDFPEKELKKSPVEEYACFISDTHVGSMDFEEKMFINFLNWLKLNTGTKSQKEIASKVKYLFVLGDVVDGIGIYPGQEKELKIKDIYKQYEAFSNYLKDLPEDIQLIIIPGNHDAVRQSEPQPPLFKDFAKSVYELSNVKNLSNPSIVNIGSIDNFSGINCFLYHGFSYTYYANNVPTLLKYGMDKPNLITEFLLKKRHLSPTHEGGLSTPERMDPLILREKPDVVATGHIHTLGYSNYKNINIIASSCFQKMTSFMQKLGHHPTPGFIPLLNLKTREIKVMDFTN